MSWLVCVFFIFILPWHGYCMNCFLNQLNRNLLSSESKDRCDFALRKYLDGLRTHENWTVSMYESSFSNAFGCGSQSFYDFGFFDECIKVHNRSANIQGKYCLASLNLGIGLSDNYNEKEQKILRQMDTPKGKWGICIPSACDSAKISSYLSPGILNFNEAHCQTQIKKTSHTDILAFTLIGMVLLTCMGSSFIDAVFNTKEKISGIPNVFVIFSFYTNARRLFRPSSAGASGKVHCLFGIQSLSIFWLTSAHFYLYTFRFPVDNIKDVVHFLGRPTSIWLLKSDLCIDTLLLVAGIMMTNTFMNIHEINCKKVVFKYLCHIVRLTVPLLFLLIVHISILKYIGSGPMWPYAEDYMIKSCSRSFWPTLFHLRNFIGTNETCVDVSWYLSLNMQIFALSPLILVPLKKYPKVTLSAILITAFVCIQMSYYSALKHSLQPFTDVFKSPGHEKRHNHYHIKIIPSLMGILAGYSIHWARSLNGNFQLNKILLGLLWIMSVIVMAVCILGGHNLLIDNNRTLDVLYITFLKPGWLISLGWLIFACDVGYGGIINKFLSLPFFRVTAKLGYSMYLLHSTLNMTILYSSRHPVTFAHVSMLYNFTCYFVLLVMGSAVWNLSFEMPVAALSKYCSGSTKAPNSNGFVLDKKPIQ